MAKPKKPAAPLPPTLEPERALSRLRWLVKKGTALAEAAPISHEQHSGWQSALEAVMNEVFGEGSSTGNSIAHAGSNVPLAMGMSAKNWEDHRLGRLRTQLAKLHAQIELREHQSASAAVADATEKPATSSGIRVFISHRATDQALAEALVDCLNAALVIPPRSLRCTSVTGYKLDVGDDGPDVLRENIRESALVVGLITDQTLDSAFVVMELGAAWALKKRTCPVLAPTVPFGSMPDAIRGTHAIRTTDVDGIGNLIDVVAREADFERKDTPSTTKAVTAFVARATELAAAALKRDAPDDTDALPLVSDDEQAIVRLKAWLRNAPMDEMRQEIRYATMDSKLRLAPGMAAKHLITIASATHDVDVKSTESVLFKARPREEKHGYRLEGGGF
jgi:TIR domain-containing protein